MTALSQAEVKIFKSRSVKFNTHLNRCRRYIVAAILLIAQQLRLSLVCYVKWSFKICLMQANRLSGLSII